MKLSDIIPITDQLKQVQGVEGELLRRKRKGTISVIVALAVAILQILIAAIEKDYLKDIGKFFNSLIHFRWGELIGPDGLSIYELTGMLILVIALGTYVLFRWTSFLLKESEEPFRYTFWIKPFEPVSGTPSTRFILKKDDQFHLLHHDLMEKLNYRIRRLSLLDVDALNLPSAAQEALTSHIHISGHYAIREKKDGEWVIHIMPRIRIGPPSSPETLADPVKYPLSGKKPKTKDILTQGITPKEDVFEDVLDADRYNQIVERVYSRIATEVYRQIFSDVKGKIAMFPTNYLRAVALFHEAKDFQRSNTVDAYDYAIELYRESKRYFDMRFFGWPSQFALRIPLLWRLVKKRQLMDARARIGYSRCLIYRRVVSDLSGRYKNPLFEIPNELEKAIFNLIELHNRINSKWKINQSLDDQDDYRETENLDRYKTLMAFLTFPKDSPLRHIRPIFERQRETLFDAYSVAALAYSNLGLSANQKAKKFLDNAKACDTALSKKNALWLLAAAEIESDINQKILLVRQAIEMAPDFEIAQYRLAQYSEMRLRMRNEIEKERVESIIKEYDEVLSINPGNIGALAAQGYLWWLLGDFEEARKKFEEGREIKAIVRQTFIDDLNYGLARIAAKNGEFNKSYDLYMQSILADPGVGSYSTAASSRGISSYYDYMAPDMLGRYERFWTGVEKKIEELHKDAKDAENKEVSEKTLNAVHSFVLNDYGNACLNYFHRFGDRKMLDKAIKAYEKAIRKHPENAVTYYNLHNAYGWRAEPDDKISKCLEKAEKLAQTWPVVLIGSIQSRVREIQNLIDEKKSKYELDKYQLGWKKEELKKANRELDLKRDQLKREEQIKGVQLKSHEDREKSPEDVENIEIKNLEDKIENLKNFIEKSEGEIIKQNDEIKKSQDNLKVVFEKLDELMNQTKFISLYQGVKIDYNGNGVSDFCKLTVEKDKLDEYDIDALRVWAELLSNNYKGTKALKASEMLCKYVQNYYPENFDIDLILYRIYSHLEKLAKQKDENTDASEDFLESDKYLFSWDNVHGYLFSWDNVPGNDSEKLLMCLRDEIDIEWAKSAEIHKSNDGKTIYIVKDENSAEIKIDKKEEKATLKTDDVKNHNLKIKKENGKLNIYVPGNDSERLLRFLKDDFDIRWAETAVIYKSDDGRTISISNDENSAEMTIDEKEEKATLEINNGRTRHLIVKKENGKLNIYSNKYNQMKEACKKRIRAALINWLSYDQIHYTSLKWTEKYFCADERIKFLENAVKLESNKAAYHDLLGDSYYEIASSSSEKEEWKKAVPVWEKAADEYREASQIEPGNQEYLDKLNSVFVYEGDAYYDRDIYLEAIEKYKKALDVQPGDTTTQSKLDRAEIALHFGKKITERFPVGTPIAVEVAGNLIPYVESETETEGLHPTLSDLSVNMREDIFKTKGVKVPGVRFRGNEDLPEGTYNIMINEIPLAKGSISEEKRLFPGPMENLTPLGGFGEETDNPLTGSEAVWILRKDWEKVERAGHTLWEVIEYMVRDLEAVIRRNLDEVLGHQEVMNMLVVQLYDIYEQMQDTPADLSALTTVIKGLLNEGVPIIEFEKIVTKFNQLKKDKKDLLTIIETIRSIPEVHRTLPGNNNQYSFYQLGRQFEEEIKQSISIEDYQPVLTMEPENVQDALTAVREQVGSNRNVAILVENAELRPFVRQLIEIEFPLVPVLSRRELLPDLEGKIIGEIKLEQQEGDLNNNYKRFQKGEEI